MLLVNMFQCADVIGEFPKHVYLNLDCVSLRWYFPRYLDWECPNKDYMFLI